MGKKTGGSPAPLGSKGFGGSMAFGSGLAFGGSSMQLAAVDDPNAALSPEAKFIFKRLAKRDATTKAKATEDLLNHLKGCNDSEILDILGIWPHFFKKLYLEEERRVRENVLHCHRLIVVHSKKSLAPHLKDVIGYWLFARFDSAREVSRLAAESFQEVFQKKQEEALSFCQASIIASVSEVVVSGSEDTIIDPRFSSPEERASAYRRLVSSAMRTLAFLIGELPEDTLSKCQSDYDSILDHSEFWAKLQSPHDDIRRSVYTLLTSILLSKKLFLLQSRENILTEKFLSQCFTDKCVTNYGEIWDAVLLLCSEFPGLWKANSVGPFKAFIAFLKNAAWGSGSVSYPALLPFVSKLPAETLLQEQNVFFSAFWTPIEKEDVLDAENTSSLISSYFECLVFFVTKISSNSLSVDANLVEAALKPLIAFVFAEGALRKGSKANFAKIAEVMLQFESKLPKVLTTAVFTKLVEAVHAGLFSLRTPKDKKLGVEAAGVLGLRLQLMFERYFAFERDDGLVLKVDMAELFKDLVEGSVLNLRSSETVHRGVLAQTLSGLLQAATDSTDEDIQETIYKSVHFLEKYFMAKDEHKDVPANDITDLVVVLLCGSKGKSEHIRKFVDMAFAAFADDLPVLTRMMGTLSKVKVDGLGASELLASRIRNVSAQSAKNVLEQNHSLFLAAALGLPQELGLITLDTKKLALTHLLPLSQTIITTLVNSGSVATLDLDADAVARLLNIFSSVIKTNEEGLRKHQELYVAQVFKLSSSGERLETGFREMFEKAWEEVMTCIEVEGYVRSLVETIIKGRANTELRVLVTELAKTLNLGQESFAHFCELFPDLDELCRPFSRASSSYHVLGPLYSPLAVSDFDRHVDLPHDVESLTAYEKTMLILFSLCEDIGVEKFLKVIERDSGRLLGGMCKYVEVCLQEHFLEYETVDMVMDRDGKEHSVHAILERLLEHVLDVDEKAVENLLAGKIGEGEGGSVMERALRRSWRSAKEGERLESLVAVKLLSKIAQKAGDDERGRIFEGLTQSAAEENSSSELELALLSQLPKDLDKVVDKNFQKALRAMAGWAKTDPVEKMDEVTRTLRTVLVLGDYVVRTESTLEDFVDEHVGVQALRRLRGLLDTTNVTVVPPMFLKYSLQLFSRFFSGGWTFDVNFQRFISSLVGKIVDEFSFYSPEAAFLIHEAFIFFGEAEKWEVWEAFGLNERDIRLCALRLALEGPDLKSSNFVAPTTFEKIIDVMHECFKHEIGERDLVAVAPAQVIKMLAVESDGCGKVAFQILSMLAARNVEGMILKVEQRTEVSEGELLGYLVELEEFAVIKAVMDLIGVIGETAHHDAGLMPHRVVLLWLVILNYMEIMNFDVKRLTMLYLREKEICFNDAIEYIVHNLNIGTSSSRPMDVSLWDVDTIDILEFDSKTPNAIPLLCAHLYLRILRILPSMIRGYWANCKSRQRALAMESYTEKFFSSSVMSTELTKLQEIGVSQLENLDVKVSKITGEVTGVYAVDEVSVDIVLKFPTCYPLRQIEVESRSGGRIIGVNEGKWRSWLLSVSIMAQNSSTLDALLLFQKNVGGHFEGKEDCAICYSVIGVIDKTLPTKTCKTCKNYFHASCLYKWFKSSNQSSCPLCRNIF